MHKINFFTIRFYSKSVAFITCTSQLCQNPTGCLLSPRRKTWRKISVVHAAIWLAKALSIHWVTQGLCELPFSRGILILEKPWMLYNIMSSGYCAYNSFWPPLASRKWLTPTYKLNILHCNSVVCFRLKGDGPDNNCGVYISSPK